MDVFRPRNSWKSAGTFREKTSSLRRYGCLWAVGLILTVPTGLRADDENEQPATNPTAAPAIAPFAMKPNRSTMTINVQSFTNHDSPMINLWVGRGSLIDVNEPLQRAAVSNPDIADVMILKPKQIMLTGKTPGTTELILWDSNDKQTAFSVMVELDVTDIREAIKRIAPGCNIDVRAVRSSLVVSGLVPTVDLANRIIEIAKLMTPNVSNQLRIAGEQQVLLRCTVAEVDKNATRQLGINGWLAGDALHDFFAVNQIDGINPVNIGAAVNTNIMTPGGIPFITDKSSGLPLSSIPTMSLGFPRVQMQLFLQAMRENTLLKILAEPNQATMNGEEGKIHVGGTIPYQMASPTGTPSMGFRDYGIVLRFIPCIAGQQKIRLTLSTEVSEPDFSIAVNGTPGFKSRNTTTTVELASGSTMAIAGLLSEQSRGAARKVPVLGDVPVLGALFSSVNYAKNITELVILVTPELVSSLEPDQVAVIPGHSHVAPNDFELMGLQLLEGKPYVDISDAKDALQTNVDPRLYKFCKPDQLSLHGPWGHADQKELEDILPR